MTHGRELSPQDEIDLFGHYGVPYGAQSTSAAAGTGTSAGRVEPAVTGAAAVGAGSRTAGNETGARTGRDGSGPTADDAMTRSEEQLRVRTESQAVTDRQRGLRRHR